MIQINEKNNKKTDYVSVCVVHYHDIDDFGEKAAGKNPPSRSDLLRTTIESIAKNTDYPIELLVWDNGGKDDDDTEYLLSKVRDGTINTLIRSKDNVHFGFGWNTLANVATGDYLAFICNDIEFGPGWLSACMDILKKHEGEKYFATPFITYDKRNRNSFGFDEWGNRINGRAGSNCMVIRRSDFEAIGPWPHHRKGGSLWFTDMFRQGYRAIAPPEDLVIDRGWRAGVNFNIPIKVKKTLLDNSEVDFTSDRTQ